MPDKRTHRGPHPADARLFGPEALATLRAALADFSLLLSKGYAEKSALKLVGDHFALTQRQRLALMRSACSNDQRQGRLSRRVEPTDLAGQTIAIDGYNLLITVEAALSGAFVFRGRDGCLRDLAGIHGTYRKVEETVPAILCIGSFQEKIGIAAAEWLLDSPVSNSGRLKTLLGELARDHNWPWQVELSTNPDAPLKRTDRIVATADSVILDACQRWTNLGTGLILECIPTAQIVDLSTPSEGEKQCP